MDSSGKIALVIKDFDLQKGGGERYSVNLARELHKKGLAFEVIARSASPELAKEFPVRFIHPEKTLFSRSLSFHKAFQKEIPPEEYSCILGLTQISGCQIYRAGGGLLSEWEKIRFNSVFGKISRLFSLNHAFTLKLEKAVLSHPRLQWIVVNSELVRQQFQNAYPLLAERVVYIGNGIDRSVFYPRNWNREVKNSYFSKMGVQCGEIYLLFVANNFRRKGLLSLMEALSHFENRERFRLIVAGSDRIAPYRAYAKRKKIDHLVHYAGPVFSQLNELYNAADVFLLPTLYDPCSNACLEALSCGLPVVTTNLNGAAMYLEKGAGHIVDVKNLKPGLLESFHWIESFWHDFHQLRQKAILSVGALTPSKNAEQMLALMHKVLDPSK
jgi:UDP-glucose:(heptosyl)LPS alpha-1,3-glucosyltransferase